MKKVSIIIPCYNAVSCIDGCIRSIVSQTMPMKDMEIILVNDASTDDTLAKLCEWEEKYPESILVVHCEENGKQGKARDIGMQYATGEYIGFMDDDDWIEPDMYESLYTKATANRCDLVICQSVKHGRDEKPRDIAVQKEDYLLELQSLEDRRQFLELDVNIAIWNKLYKRELLINNAIDFPPGYIYDDIYFSALVKRYCQRVYVCQKIMYHHIISETSVSYGAKNPMDRIGFIEVHMMLIEELRNRELYQDFAGWYEENFVIDYLTFIMNFEKSFGALNEELAAVIKSGIWELFPHFEQIPLVQTLLNSEKKQLFKRIIQEVIKAKPDDSNEQLREKRDAGMEGDNQFQGGESQEIEYMTRQQIYSANIYLQSIIDNIIYACHTQNYDKVIRTFTDVTKRLMSVLEAVFADISFYNQEMDIVNPVGVNASLQDILVAQENKDYVLLADLLELQLVPFLQSVQEAIRAYEVESVSPTAWERNMSVLKNRDEALWKQIMAYHEEYERANAAGTWQGAHHLEDTNCGAFTMAGQDTQGVYYYHSNVNPLKEASDFARYYYQPGCEDYVIWGLGLGYHVREMLRLDDGIQLTIYESDMDVIYHCLNAVDMSTYLGMASVTLIYDPQFTKIIDTLEKITENFILHYPSLRHIENERIRQQMEMFFIRDSGKRNVAILFENNSRENFKNMDGYVDELRPAFEGKDVVIVAAGPSLDKNVELLKKKKPNMVIVAVETVFRKLVNLGVSVDYMIVADANSRIYGHLVGLENQPIPMLYLSTAYKGFAKNYQGPKYLICQSGYDKAEELAEKNGWKLYETGGSVSTTALDVCISLGAKSIAFIGLDLAYTGGHAHATGAAAREATGLEDMQQVPAVAGGTVATSKLFIMYNKWIENRIKKEDVTMPIFDATEGGAIVPGLSVITLKEFME